MAKLVATLAALMLLVGGAVQAAPPYIPPDTTFTPYEIAPEPLPDFSEAPAYPEAAKAEKVDATVIVKVYVWTDGSVQAFKIVSDSQPCYGFGTEVAETIAYWKFTPAIQSGEPVGVWIGIPLQLQVQGCRPEGTQA